MMRDPVVSQNEMNGIRLEDNKACDLRYHHGYCSPFILMLLTIFNIHSREKKRVHKIPTRARRRTIH